MSKQYDSEGFMSTPLEGAGARPKNDYRQDSEDTEVRFREADEEFHWCHQCLYLYFRHWSSSPDQLILTTRGQRFHSHSLYCRI